MVVVPSELEQKKKRQTLERAKANHLSKQLQMRLQYAKLKVEHGWQRQNLNEVENLYFHHSHLRSVRQAHATADSVAPSGVSDQPPPSLSPPPSIPDGPSSPPLDPPVPAAFASSSPVASVSVNRPPSALDLADPHILARLAQLQAHIQIPPHSAPRQQSTAISPQPLSVPTPGIAPFPPPLPPHPAVAVPFPTYPPQSFVGTPTSGSVPLYVHTSTSTPSPSLAPVATASAAPMTTSQTSVAPSALTYDSFWSTHASSTGPTRALYRTHTGFTASATPTGNVAMLTPGGNAAVMTADGVYVGGATGRSG